MGMADLFRKLSFAKIWRLLMIVGIAIILTSLFRCFAFPCGQRWSLLPTDKDIFVLVNANFSNNSTSSKMHFFHMVVNDTYSSELEKQDVEENEAENTNTVYNEVSHKNKLNEFISKVGVQNLMGYVSTGDNSSQAKAIDNGHDHIEEVQKEEENNVTSGITLGGAENSVDAMPGSSRTSNKNMENMNTDSRTYISLGNVLSLDNVTTMRTQHKNTPLLQTVSVMSDKNSTRANMSLLKRRKIQPTTISQMNSLVLQSSVSSHSVSPRWSSLRDHELQSAKLRIENAPTVRKIPGIDASVFRNFSRFKMSYELMEHILKVYIYKEGEKPIFHQSKMRGIYASEGWFMKLMEGNKKFGVRDPRKAHLFYLPFSSHILRTALYGNNFNSQKDLEEYLKRYVDLIAQKYSFWNRTGGADHFLVGCHDWAPRFTRKYMRNCIRALCNANVAKDFKIGKDTSLPATYIRSVEAPLQDLGGKPPSERPVLAFFAGGMHGYVRPILLQYWENKEPDMKIFGQMSRDIEGKRTYREYMKGSKYCICPRGYEVYTPRLIEAIYYECVPVIISDNYVPPFFEVLNWEAFAVFVQEKDIPNLRNILISIPEERYLKMQLRVKMVQQHFLWHKNPVKYDLFHMILHSIWYNRVFH